MFLSALLQMKKRAQDASKNAVVNIVSNYNNVESSSATEFECHEGAIMAWRRAQGRIRASKKASKTMLGQAILAMTDLRGVSDAALVSLLPWLGEAEQERWRRFQRSERRRQFIVGRVLARMLLGELCGVAPGALQLHERGGRGRRWQVPTVRKD
ncbi:hypothetical protein LP419_36680 [Massilia sp. H-1]|nr:hypothetical protein LP419_36680 [Massilia sp. H-1]